MTERLNLIIKYLNLTPASFAASINVSQTLIHYYTKGRTPSLEVVQRIVKKYPEIDCHWLITGEGEMLLSNVQDVKTSYNFLYLQQNGYAPFYSHSQVSGIEYDLAKLKQTEEPNGWVKMVSGVTIDALFSIVGCSMEPKIYAGDTIGVINLPNWDRIDPDKIYLIITNDNIMLKHLQIDNENPDIIWAVSENYSKFKVYVNEIKKIYCVLWVGRFI